MTNSGNEGRIQEMRKNMRKRWVLRGFRFALFGLAAVVVFGWITASLWNWIMPEVFGLGMISFWQALGLLVLGRILFGGFRGGRGCGGYGRRRRGWESMTPEEREKFRGAVESRCGG